MLEEHTRQEQLAELAPIVDQLVEIVKTAGNAFLHQRAQLLTQLDNQKDPLYREIDSAILKMNEMLFGKSGSKKEFYLRLHSILTHLRIIFETTWRLQGTQLKQIKSGILFSDKAISQVGRIFDKQSEILTCLADILRNSGKELRHRALEECKILGQSCMQFVTDHETRLVEGLCVPQAAPIFLEILDQMQTIVHHERGIAQLVGNSFEDDL